ncbi:hypothetical protein RCCS2_04679 [Roseobacter sp. CCS2]|nr:hypothetical protein RCCS2_04679 [Roseobacter sp. CCS2]
MWVIISTVKTLQLQSWHDQMFDKIIFVGIKLSMQTERTMHADTGESEEL